MSNGVFSHKFLTIWVMLYPDCWSVSGSSNRSAVIVCTKLVLVSDGNTCAAGVACNVNRRCATLASIEALGDFGQTLGKSGSFMREGGHAAVKHPHWLHDGHHYEAQHSVHTASGPPPGASNGGCATFVCKRLVQCNNGL